MIVVTGGAGFIGSAVIRHLLDHTPHSVINLDKLTYAGNTDSIPNAASNPRYCLEVVDIYDVDAVARVFETHQPTAVMHLAAESHVDRSIDGPGVFIQTNVIGTYTLLEQSRSYYQTLNETDKAAFRSRCRGYSKLRATYSNFR